MGSDVLTRADAWAVYDQLCTDGRIVTVNEPDALEPIWRSLSTRDDSSHKLWTDDYLSAFDQSMVGSPLASASRSL